MESDKIEQQRNKVTKPGFSGPEAERGICHLKLCSFVTLLFILQNQASANPCA
jgi:hypothetical protein